MAQYAVGDIVVLSAGSMRMAVEQVEGDTVHTVWCNEGTIGRDKFPAVLLRKWEQREDSGSRGKPYGGGRDGGRDSKPYGGGRDGGRDGGGRDDKPRGKPGWDGKPREKKYFRKD